MPIETAAYVNQLVASNPVHTEGLGQADSHLRLIKSAVAATFPNLNGPVTAAPADLNSTIGLMANGVLTVAAPSGSATTGGSVVLKGAGTNADITLRNASGGLVVLVGATPVLTVDGTGAVATGTVGGSMILQAGHALLPSGVILKWAGSVAPAGYQFCDGTNGSPDLRDKFVVGAGLSLVIAQTGGALAQVVSTVLAGAHSHGGATGAAGGHAHTAWTDTQGAHSHGGATQGYALQLADIPSHQHGQHIGQGSGGPVTAWSVSTGNVETGCSLHTDSVGGGGAHAHGMSVDGAHGHNVGVSSLSDHAHTVIADSGHQHVVTVPTLPPFYALAFIIKL